MKTDDLDHRANDPNTRYPTDHVHFGTLGTWEMGRRFAEAMVRGEFCPKKQPGKSRRPRRSDSRAGIGESCTNCSTFPFV
ncbi:MAG: hypothetical protein R3F31_23620 [Verrucomicrobiales bacterium]